VPDDVALQLSSRAGQQQMVSDAPDGSDPSTLAEPVAELAALFAADRADHGAVPPVGTPEYAALRARDRERRARALALLDRVRTAGMATPEALHHTAWLLNHGEASSEARLAHDLAREAAEHGYAPARWLAAAAYDRACMYEGRPQKYGTQFVPDGMRYRLWDVEPATTDADRAAWDVPPLAQQVQRAEAMTRTEPQPPLDGAPGWLTDAVVRWRAAGPGASPPAG
jgi:hypothetical protein